jgi:hypothetical protein
MLAGAAAFLRKRGPVTIVAEINAVRSRGAFPEWDGVSGSRLRGMTWAEAAQNNEGKSVAPFD